MLEFEEAHPGTKDPRLKAGQEAERQMAHLLNRRFRQQDRVILLHGLRLEKPGTLDVNGKPEAAQIDHLLLHKHGAFIVESKSCTGVVRVNSDPSGYGDWSRSTDGKKFVGMRSPIEQAMTQARFLRDLLCDHTEEILGKIIGVQKGFGNIGLQVIAAISDDGQIERGEWQPIQRPLASEVLKAGNVPEWIAKQLGKHRTFKNILLPFGKEVYGVWFMTKSEVHRTAEFLCDRHTPSVMGKPGRKPPGSTASRKGRTKPIAACKNCGERTRLDPRSGRYGYYWACEVCQTNTGMKAPCSACGASAKGDVRVSKRGDEYVRACSVCGVDEVIWRSAPSGGA